MKWKLLILCIGFISIWIKGISQPIPSEEATVKDTLLVNSLLQQSREHFNDDPDKALALAIQAKELAEKNSFENGVGYALKNIGICYFNQSKYLEALDFWNQAIKVFESINDKVGVSNMLANIGSVHYNQGDNEKALEYFLNSLKFAEESGNKLRIQTALINIGAVYSRKKETYDKALHYYLMALPISEELNDKGGIGTASVNIGEIYSAKGQDSLALLYLNKSLKARENMESVPYSYNKIGEVYQKQGRFDMALNYHNQALTIAEKLNGQLYIVQSLLELAKTYHKMEDNKIALSYYKRAEELGVEINAKNELKEIYQGMSTSYALTKDYGNAFQYQSLYANIKDTLYNIETDKKLGSLQFDFDLQKKQGEINLLTKDKTLKEVELKRQKLAKNALSVGLVLVFVIAFIIFRNYRAKVKINKILDHQKDQIEHLLLNILPMEVARELKDNGRATPRDYESVSVLFTDFKGFTTIADKMSPAELVDELNICFMAFDDIIEKNNLEKIKTIGDSYMCAGGIPTPDNQHPYNIVKAGLEIQQYVIQNNQRRAEKGLLPWDVRVGIHAGPIVAGVVGKKKYAYDIWGSTVNIASRMESNGEPGQVNISSAIYELIKDKYTCRYRGKIYAKNVGEIDMYFIDHEVEAINNISVEKESENSLQETIPEQEEKKFNIDTLYG